MAAIPGMTAAPDPKRGRRLRRRLAITAAVVVAWGLGRLPGSESATAAATNALLALWLIVLGVALTRWLWRKLTYRVGVRLFLSYLLIGLVPFPLLALLGAVAGYMVIGQYGARSLGTLLDAESQRLSARAEVALRELGRRAPEAAVDAIKGGGGETVLAPVRTEWLLADGGRSWRSDGAAALAVPAWAGEGEWRGTVLVESKPYLAVVERRGQSVAALLVPLDIANGKALSDGRWFAVRFLASQRLAELAARREKDKESVTLVVGEKSDAASSGVRLGGEEVSAEQIEPGWAQTKVRSGSFWQQLTIAWMKSFEKPRLWSDGGEAKGWMLIGLVKVSVGGAVADLFTSPRNIAGEVSTALFVITVVFGSMYLVAVSFAVVMILSITRSTARLSRGAREVATGNLDWRIPVKRRDQLGDLAVSFNAMTEAVRGMLTQVAEKERLSRELELAREIQESLLPRRDFRHGGLQVHALFRPAAEVGGDYFDLFPVGERRLLIAAGDVAGHGLSTGLLMAMVKSAVAALIQEGHRGVDLLERLNQLLLGQELRHRMVTLALIEIDEDAGTVEVTNGGHPPVYVVAPDGGVEEVMAAALPLGHRWPQPPARRSAAFLPGSRLVIYSDGLVEAADADGQPLGYDALRAVLERNGRLPAHDLLAALLAELDRYTGGAPLADDLTILVVESGPRDAA